MMLQNICSEALTAQFVFISIGHETIFSTNRRSCCRCARRECAQVLSLPLSRVSRVPFIRDRRVVRARIRCGRYRKRFKMSLSTARPLVTVYTDKNKATPDVLSLPAVFKAPIRPDIVNVVHQLISTNKRQPYCVSKEAGHQTSAESWGTGRAVARIPRVRGGGTHRSGQGAFGNMCRGGRMFAPTKPWRRWHHRVNVNQKRYALVSAIAASGVPALVQSKGHMIQDVPEFPLVVTDKIQDYTKTKQAVIFLRRIKAWNDIQKVYKSKRFRAGKGKMRNRRHIQRRGPLIVYGQDRGIRKAFRNIPGVDLMNINKMNLLKLAPGGHVGRFVIWTQSAFEQLDSLYGTWRKESLLKKGYNLPFPKMANTDLTRLLKSEEIRKVLRAPRKKVVRRVKKMNPLANTRAMLRLNPYAAVLRRAAILNDQRRKLERERLLAAKRGIELPKDSAAAKALALRVKRKTHLIKATLSKGLAAAKKAPAKDQDAAQLKAKRRAKRETKRLNKVAKGALLAKSVKTAKSVKLAKSTKGAKSAKSDAPKPPVEETK
ncbi:60S ribosomal protein L4 [Pseudomyrmex gracilis]|uniref:60S ribosomal protein L4 n=1 Tax=Pseudomyrmex gracilis TaxID=219809 RepID=UPI00099499BA|nr:60S ribosomal protein L4 [Pseudomyrmex gracilis]